jgi:hypothetical protein
LAFEYNSLMSDIDDLEGEELFNQLGQKAEEGQDS